MCLFVLPFFTKARISRWIVGAVAGFLWAWFHGYTLLNERLPSDWEGRDLIVEGRVSSLPVSSAWGGKRFDLDTQNFSVDGAVLPLQRGLHLTWYGTPPPLVVGELWRLPVRLRLPHGQMSPGSFDQEGWSFQYGTQGVGSVRPTPTAERLDASTWPYTIGRIRQSLAIDIAAAQPNTPYLGLLQGLAIGETSAVTAAQWDILVRTGTIHLLAISGSHIALVAGLAYLIVRGLWPWLGWLLPLLARFAAPRVAALVAIFAGAGYAALAGFPVPTQRAVVMVCVTMGAVLVGRSILPTRTLSQALLAVLLWDPMAVIDAGFWLSFGAVAFILHCVAGRIGRLSHWRSFGQVQWGVTVGLLPILLALFQRIAVYSPLANLIAIPWLEVGTVPILLAGALLLPIFPTTSSWLLSWCDLSISGLWPILTFFADLPFNTWSPPAPPAWAVAIAVIGAWVLLMPRGFPVRWLGLVYMAPLALLPAPRPPAGEIWFSALDVGQGLSAVVQTANHTLVYDTGPGTGHGHDAGSTIVVPFLRHEGIQHLDALMVSHADNDHSGGAASIRAALPIERLLGAIPAGETCVRDITWNWDGVVFRVIHPTADTTFEDNDASCVLRVEWTGGALLLTGDIGKAAERELVTNHPEDLRATVIVAPHHGSHSGSTAAFVGAVRPEMVVFATGYHNRYHFPNADVVARYQAAGAQSFNTARQGTLTFRFSPGKSITVQSWREKARHYWNFPVPPTD